MREIKLVRSQLCALVDDEDRDKVSCYRWYLYRYPRSCYAKAIINNKMTSMQNFLYPPPSGYFVDHKNSNGLDNQKDNLRHATIEQQRHNLRKHEDGATSQYKGVSRSKRKGVRFGMFVAQICINGKQTNLGYYPDEVSAAKAYDRAAKLHYKEFAFLNFPDKGEGGV